MSKYITIKDNRDNLDELYAKIKKLENMEIRVGIFKEDSQFLLMIARVHEFGVSIKVTEKMRGYLGSQGLHLRADTTHINIPERSYLRSAANENKKLMGIQITNSLEDYLRDKISFNAFTSEVGNFLTNLIKKQMIELKSPELHPFTIEQKGSSDPLIDSGNLLNGITYKVVT